MPSAARGGLGLPLKRALIIKDIIEACGEYQPMELQMTAESLVVWQMMERKNHFIMEVVEMKILEIKIHCIPV